MEDLNNIALNSLERYFTVLESIGYISQAETNKVLLLQFLQEMLQEYPYFITEEDYTTIERVVQCLSETTCLIPYREYQQVSLPLTGYVFSIPIRVTQGEDIRHTQVEDALRLVNQ